MKVLQTIWLLSLGSFFMMTAALIGVFEAMFINPEGNYANEGLHTKN